MSRLGPAELPTLPGLMDADDVVASGASIAAAQHRSGMIPWFPGGASDPWNHVEAAMALDASGHRDEAVAAYRFLAETQLPQGPWPYHRTVDDEGRIIVIDDRHDLNTIAYLACGLWHHWLTTGDLGLADDLWEVMHRAIEFVLAPLDEHGVVPWALHHDGTPYDDVLLTGCSSICHSLRAAARVAELLEQPQPSWELAASTMAEAIRERPGRFTPKDRWAMDWYYPVLSGALDRAGSQQRLIEGRDRFVIDGAGVRCVSDQPWVTAAETAECAIAHQCAGLDDHALELLASIAAHRRPDGAYLTGIVVPDGRTFPHREASTYSTAAVILAVAALSTPPGAPQLWAPATS